MRAGLLRERIVFEKPQEINTPSGFVKESYTPVLSTKAYRKKISTKVDDKLNALEEFKENVIVFQVRFNRIIDEKQHIVYNGNRYEIRLLDKQIEDNTYLITCIKINE